MELSNLAQQNQERSCPARIPLSTAGSHASTSGLKLEMRKFGVAQKCVLFPWLWEVLSAKAGETKTETNSKKTAMSPEHDELEGR